MRLAFTKMHGAGNDFVVLDATRTPLALSTAQLRRLGDRRFGVGCDQILVVEPAVRDGADFRYRIYNGADGSEVEHCGNGARCFLRFVRDAGLTSKDRVVVDTVDNRLELQLEPDGRVTVDMNRPRFEPERVPFDAGGLLPREVNGFALWPLDGLGEPAGAAPEVAVLSMGNPHAVLRVEDVAGAPVATLGPRIERHPRFPRRVNVGFLQVVDRGRAKLRVWERAAGETLACGSGACAAVVAGIRAGWLDRAVEVELAGGTLRIAWPADDAHVLMTGPARTVYTGEIEL